MAIPLSKTASPGSQSQSTHKADLSVDTVSLVPSVDPAMEKVVWRKLDLYVLPMVALFYLLSFLDRTNVSNARVAGMQVDLKMTNYDYSMALTVTYIPYIITELPSNLLLKVCHLSLLAVGPNLLLPAMLTLWGVVTTCQGVVTTYGGLLTCRFFLGLLEGGVFPGLVLYLSYFYPRQKLNLRISGFFSSASVAGAFGGILAYGIVHMEGVGGKPGWSWIFILEGLFTVVVGITGFFVLPRTPQHARFLSAKEKEYVTEQLKAAGATARDENVDGFSWNEVGKAFGLPQVWFTALVYFFDGVILYGLAYFAPSIVQGLGYAGADAQLMTVPPFAAAFVFSLVCAFVSDHYRCRGYITIISSILCVIGFSMFLSSPHQSIQYGSLFLSISGTYTVAPTVSAWGANNVFPHTRRATAIAIGFIMSNSGGILATWLLGSLSAAPRYHSATVTMLIMSVLMIVFTGLNLGYLWSQNKKKAQIRATSTQVEERPGLGDRSAWFIYSL
ncbi:major facilitator superfamily domain-containing protein [Schizophyllum commune]